MFKEMNNFLNERNIFMHVLNCKN